MTGHVWIIGASSGIGRALALKMAAEGWQVTASARSLEPLHSLASQGGGGRISPLVLDVTDLAATRQAATRLAEEGPCPDMVVLNAGTHRPDSMETFKADEIRGLIDLNIMGVINGIDAVLPGMLQRGQGHLVLVSSMAGWRGLPAAAAYSASKAAVIALGESLRFEGRRRGIKVQVVAPGFVRTPLTDKNDFPMPFLMDADKAADAFYKGLMSDRFEISFPTRFAIIMKLMSLLPASLYFPLVGRMTGK